jgi:peptide/nickel transport system substrate-binding protein
MQWMIHRTGGVGIPVFISLLDGYDRRIRGLQPVPLGGLMGYTFGEHVWLDA